MRVEILTGEHWKGHIFPYFLLLNKKYKNIKMNSIRRTFSEQVTDAQKKQLISDVANHGPLDLLSFICCCFRVDHTWLLEANKPSTPNDVSQYLDTAYPLITHGHRHMMYISPRDAHLFLVCNQVKLYVFLQDVGFDCSEYVTMIHNEDPLPPMHIADKIKGASPENNLRFLHNLVTMEPSNKVVFAGMKIFKLDRDDIEFHILKLKLPHRRRQKIIEWSTKTDNYVTTELELHALHTDHGLELAKYYF